MTDKFERLAAAMPAHEKKALADFLAASTRQTRSPRETEARLQMSLAVTSRKIKPQA